MFLYSTVSTLKPSQVRISCCPTSLPVPSSTRRHHIGGQGFYVPIVGIVVTISPSLSLYRIVVFPAASSPTIRIRISFLPHRRSNSFENVRPILAVECRCYRREVVWLSRMGVEGRTSLMLTAELAHVHTITCAPTSAWRIYQGRSECSGLANGARCPFRIAVGLSR